MTLQIFVLGNSRSGTTMLARILAMGQDAADLRELHFIEQMITGEAFKSPTPLGRAEAQALAARLISVIRDGYFHGTSGAAYADEAQKLVTNGMTASNLFEAVRLSETKRLGKTVPIDQTPRNVFYIKDILAAYPEARIVCMVRDPRDVCLSQKGKWRRRFLGANIPLFEALRSWANYHPWVTAKIWAGAVKAGDAAADNPRVLVIRFEDITKDPEKHIRAICDHCGLTFTPNMLEVEQIGSSDRRDEAGKTGVDASRVGTWEKSLSGAEIAICEAQAGPLLARHGYAPSTKHGTALSRVLWMVALPFKLGLALALNLKRVRNLWSWARKRMAA